MQRRKIENKKGITLIGLIITIIVMLILVAVTVDVAIDGKLFDKADEAVDKTSAKVAQQQNRVDELMGILEEVGQEQCSHTYGEWVLTKAATCIETGTKTRTCTKCGKEEIQTIPISHQYSDGTCTECGTTCTNHTYGEWTITKEATCTELGSKSRTCSNCGNVEIEAIATKEHTYSNGTCTECGAACESHTYGEWVVIKEATCTEAGERTRTCIKCGYVQIEPITVEHTFSNGTCTECGVACTSHTYGDWEIVTAATCTAEGSKTHTCTICGQGATESIAATGHSYGEWETTTAATCTTVGTKTKTCTVCSDKQTESIAATGHSYGEWVTTTAATCTASGTQTKTCTACGDAQTQAIAALGHNYVSATCSRCGVKDLITFSLYHRDYVRTFGTWTAERGMTWYDWLNSSYNTTVTYQFENYAFSTIYYNGVSCLRFWENTGI